MNRRTAFCLVTGMSLILAEQVPASVKPCRDAAGKVIPCPKVRKPSPRCRDANGKFVPCPPARDAANGQGAKEP